ncbi:MAG: IgA Peptidase M64 [Candidatus Marinimicrobia bacterium]|nr:IgA Peptidase M64 [Candidatus Neomarinimicrobiota bacterium]
MKQLKLITLIMVLGVWIFAATGPQFDEFFRDQTMRLDFYFTGTKTQNLFSLDAIYTNPGWAGSQTNLIDTLNLGHHLIRVYDAESQGLLYSRGFSSIFNEWQSTDEAAHEIWRTFHFSILIPFPQKNITVTLSSRDHQNQFIEKFRTSVEPDSRFIIRDKVSSDYRLRKLIDNGPSSQKIDLLILPEGYTKAEMRKFRQRCNHFLDVFFNVSPFQESADKFNVWMLEVPSAESGIDNPREGIFKQTAFDLTFNSLDLDRYVLTLNNKTVRDIAAQAPYDQIIFIFNSNKYGGGGIFNLYSTCYSTAAEPEQSSWPDYVFVHEFGHSFAGLADEYYTSSTPYNDLYPVGVEPWEPNITALLNPAELKWSDLVTPDIPLPTPWEKAFFDQATKDHSNELEQILKSQKNYGQVGAFQGAGYASEGLYRPCLDCIMFSRHQIAFCPVCQTAILKVIRFNTE